MNEIQTQYEFFSSITRHNLGKGMRPPMLKKTLIACLWTLAVSPAMAAMTMTVNTKSGDTIGGTYKFDVRVQSEHLVTNVEFYVGDDLRSTDESTPYQFDFDTLEEAQGKLIVTFAAFNSEGESVKQKLDLTIDNGFSKGVQFHVDQSKEFLRTSKFNEAIQSSRIALKIDSKSNIARMAMARANFAKGIMDVAQKFAEDVVTDDPKNVDAKSLLTAISLKKVFSASGDDTVSTIQGALQSASKNQFDLLNMRADSAGEPTGDNLIPYADAQISAHRYSRAISALMPTFEKSQADSEIANRLAFAQLRSARFSDLGKTILLHKRYGEPDAYFFAIEAIAFQLNGDTAKSELSEREALLSDPTNKAVKYSQAYLALARTKMPVLASITSELENISPNDPMNGYYKTISAYYNRDIDAARYAFQTALLADPANYDLFIERGNQQIQSVYSLGLTGSAKTDQFLIAAAYYKAALEARPESFEALTALCIVNLLMGKNEDAVTYGRGASAAAPEYGIANFALAAAFRATNNTAGANAAMKAAGETDSRLKGRLVPKPEEAYTYFYRNARIPLIPSPANQY